MRRVVWRGLVGVLVCGLSLTLGGLSQSGSPRPAPRAPQVPGAGGRPQRPGVGQGQPQRPRPQPGRPGPQPSRPAPQPTRPARPVSGGGRPQRPGNNGKPQPGRPGGRPPQWGRPPQNRPPYQFRPNDQSALGRHYYSHLRYINRGRRPRFSIGGYFPYGDIGYLSPLPPSLYGQMPPPPNGYELGYFDGYVVVYDPLTYFIANLVDLLQ